MRGVRPELCSDPCRASGRGSVLMGAGAWSPAPCQVRGRLVAWSRWCWEGREEGCSGCPTRAAAAQSEPSVGCGPGCQSLAGMDPTDCIVTNPSACFWGVQGSVKPM